ncbi:MAG: hypothetical protein AAFZ87_20640 [Planctomycetota bacterium]
MSPSATLPTGEELESLPYFAILALGARCAKTVGPVFESWEGATRDQVSAVARAALDVEKLAASPSMVSRAPLWGPARQSTRGAADAATAADMAEAPHAALCAADAAAELSAAIDLEAQRSVAAGAVSRTIRACIGALGDTDGSQQREFLEWVTWLVRHLGECAAAERWTDESPVTIRNR